MLKDDLTQTKPDFNVVFTTPWNYLCIMAPRGGGKTILSMQVTFNKYLLNKDKPRCKCGFFGPTEGAVKDIIAPVIMSYKEIIDRKYGNNILKFNKTTGETTIDFGNGDTRRMYVGSYEQGEKLRGKHLDFLVLDEMSLCPDNLFYQVIKPIMIHMGTKAKILAIGTPKPGTGDLFIRLFEKGLPENKTKQWLWLEKYKRNEVDENEENNIDSLRWKSILYKASTSNLLDPIALEAEKAGMPKEVYEMEYECNYNVQVGTGFIFANKLAKIQENIRDDINYNRNYPVYAAWDLGYTCMTTCWIYQIIGNNKHYLDYYEGSSEHISVHLNEILEKPYKIALHILPHDAVQQRVTAKESAYQTFINFGCRVYKLERTKTLGLDIMYSAESILSSYFNKTNCKNGLDHLKRYEVKTDKYSDVSIPCPTSGSISHADATDAFRYSWQAGNILDRNKEKIKIQYTDRGSFYSRKK